MVRSFNKPQSSRVTGLDGTRLFGVSSVMPALETDGLVSCCQRCALCKCFSMMYPVAIANANPASKSINFHMHNVASVSHNLSPIPNFAWFLVSANYCHKSLFSVWLSRYLLHHCVLINKNVRQKHVSFNENTPDWKKYTVLKDYWLTFQGKTGFCYCGQPIQVGLQTANPVVIKLLLSAH